MGIVPVGFDYDSSLHTFGGLGRIYKKINEDLSQLHLITDDFGNKTKLLFHFAMILQFIPYEAESFFYLLIDVEGRELILPGMDKLPETGNDSFHPVRPSRVS